MIYLLKVLILKRSNNSIIENREILISTEKQVYCARTMRGVE